MRKYSKAFLVSAAVLVFFGAISAAAPTSLPAPQQPNEKELIDRFNHILNEKLGAKNVSVSEDAAKDLQEIVETSAKQVVEKQQFSNLDQADRNLKTFAKRLLKNAERLEGKRQITPWTIDRTLNGVFISPPHSIVGQRVGGLCPLFPLC